MKIYNTTITELCSQFHSTEDAMHYYHLLSIKYEILNKLSVQKTMVVDLQNRAGRE